MVLGSEVDLNGPDPETRVSRYRKNTRFRPFLAVFVGYSTRFWGPWSIQTVRVDVTRFSQNRKKLAISAISGVFLWAIAHGFGVRGRFKRPGSP